jgi:hypothetical protein
MLMILNIGVDQSMIVVVIHASVIITSANTTQSSNV